MRRADPVPDLAHGSNAKNTALKYSEGPSSPSTPQDKSVHNQLIHELADHMIFKRKAVATAAPIRVEQSLYSQQQEAEARQRASHVQTQLYVSTEDNEETPVQSVATNSSSIKKSSILKKSKSKQAERVVDSADSAAHRGVSASSSRTITTPTSPISPTRNSRLVHEVRNVSDLEPNEHTEIARHIRIKKENEVAIQKKNEWEKAINRTMAANRTIAPFRVPDRVGSLTEEENAAFIELDEAIQESIKEVQPSLKRHDGLIEQDPFREEVASTSLSNPASPTGNRMSAYYVDSAAEKERNAKHNALIKSINVSRKMNERAQDMLKAIDAADRAKVFLARPNTRERITQEENTDRIALARDVQQTLKTAKAILDSRAVLNEQDQSKVKLASPSLSQPGSPTRNRMSAYYVGSVDNVSEEDRNAKRNALVERINARSERTVSEGAYELWKEVAAADIKIPRPKLIRTVSSEPSTGTAVVNKNTPSNEPEAAYERYKLVYEKTPHKVTVEESIEMGPVTERDRRQADKHGQEMMRVFHQEALSRAEQTIARALEAQQEVITRTDSYDASRPESIRSRGVQRDRSMREVVVVNDQVVLADGRILKYSGDEVLI